MRIAIVDDSAGRAAIIAEGLRDAGLTDTVVLTERHALLARLEAIAPEVVLVDLENPSRDVLEEYFVMSRALARPIAMFVDQSDEETTAAAVDAGVSAYVVAGLSRQRIKPVLDLAIRRFQAFSRLKAELHEARTALADRAAVDRAKAILIRRRGLDEPAAYALLRRHAMASNRRIAEVADAIVTAEALMGDAPGRSTRSALASCRSSTPRCRSSRANRGSPRRKASGSTWCGTSAGRRCATGCYMNRPTPRTFWPRSRSPPRSAGGDPRCRWRCRSSSA